MKQTDAAYFAAARDWHAEKYAEARVRANRWYVACLFLASCLLASVIALITLLPLKTLVPLVVHQNTITGEAWVTKPATDYVPETDAETQADIVRYITSRESYTSHDLNQRFQFVTLLSDSNVTKTYANEQSNNNSKSPVNILNDKGTRTVRVEDIVFIDKQNTKELRHFKQSSNNLAKVDFTTTTTLPNGAVQTESWVATIAWQYRGLPNTQNDAWDNWNGFTVTAYRVDQRNIQKGNAQ